MARIRTIKPDFWTDEKLIECSAYARLFFIGMFNFADDNGNLCRAAKKLKMQIFPGDEVDCERLVLELLQTGVIQEYEVAGEMYLHIKNFRRHQVINRPSKSSIPKPGVLTEQSTPINANPLRPHGTLTESSVSHHGSLIDGREGKGKEKDCTPKNAESDQNGEKRESPSPVGDTDFAEMDDKALVFDIGVTALTRLGLPQKSARGMVGKCLKELSVTDALALVGRLSQFEEHPNPAALMMTLINEAKDPVLLYLRQTLGPQVRPQGVNRYYDPDSYRHYDSQGNGEVVL